MRPPIGFGRNSSLPSCTTEASETHHPGPCNARWSRFFFFFLETLSGKKGREGGGRKKEITALNNSSCSESSALLPIPLTVCFLSFLLRLMARMKNKPALKGNGKGSGSARQGIDLNVISRVVNLQTAAAYEDGRIYIECVRERESGGKGGGGTEGM